jgi:hypothetical protein
MARDRECAVKVIQLFAIEPYGLLAAPAETFRPGRIAKHYTLLRAFVWLQTDFNAPVRARRL